MKMAEQSPSWQSLGAAKRQAILDSIPEKWRLSSIPAAEEQRDVTGAYTHQFLTLKQTEITETDAVGIVEKTTSGVWSAVEVAEAFCHRASLAHQLTNCLHETFFEAAMSDAKDLDDYLAENGKPKGPLHGLPVSLKDQFHVKGVDTTMGYIGWIDTFRGLKGDARNRTFESEMVRELRELGAVLFCKTSVPHTLMTGETINNIIDYTWNPRNRHLGSGGSSGGEGALIAFHGSPGGFGTDIGGSIRIPSASCGLFGIRPTVGRLPYEGMANSMDGQNTVLSVVGPMATSARSLKLLFRSILSAEPWMHDPLVAEIPWRQDLERDTLDKIGAHKLTVGMLEHDGLVGVHPPIKRALDILRNILSSAGHQILPWNPPVSHQVIQDLLGKAWNYDGGADVMKDFALSGEPMSEQVRTLVNDAGVKANASEIADTNRALRDIRKEYLEYWNSTGVDVLIAPVAAHSAARRGRYKYYGYTSTYNGLDYPSVVVPVTVVDKGVDVAETSFQPMCDLDKEIQQDYDAEIYDGAPVCLQVVGRRFNEEKLLAIAEWLEGEIQKPL